MKQKADILAFKRDENLVIPETIDYDCLSGLSNEVKSKFKEIKPKTFLKGGDYSGQEDFEDFIFCRDNNIRIEIIELKDGFSTTGLIEKKGFLLD